MAAALIKFPQSPAGEDKSVVAQQLYQAIKVINA
jgi:hypothetical protein